MVVEQDVFRAWMDVVTGSGYQYKQTAQLLILVMMALVGMDLDRMVLSKDNRCILRE